ncbi:MAG: DUF3806 domain-containing protein [Bacteroidia bacterium]|nr:DUF3806 domain-containing protein [Bacteroidia bacterium]
MSKNIIGPDGQEYSEQETTEEGKKKLDLEDLKPEEVEYLENLQGLAGELLQGLPESDPEHPFAPANVEALLKIGQEQNLQEKYGIETNFINNALAAAWGKYLEDSFGMQWKIITDQYGRETGLYHEKNSLTVFPFSLLEKAVRKEQWGLFSIISNKIREVL